MRLVIAMAVIGAVVSISVSGALADSAVGTQNPTFTANISAFSDGANPDVATDGDKVVVNVSVTNVTATDQYARLYLNSNFPKAHDFNRLRLIRAGETWTWSQQFKINGEKIPASAYSFTVDAYGGGDTVIPSEATATITVV
jgi:hypothetical protein